MPVVADVPVATPTTVEPPGLDVPVATKFPVLAGTRIIPVAQIVLVDGHATIAQTLLIVVPGPLVPVRPVAQFAHSMVRLLYCILPCAKVKSILPAQPDIDGGAASDRPAASGQRLAYYRYAIVGRARHNGR